MVFGDQHGLAVQSPEFNQALIGFNTNHNIIYDGVLRYWLLYTKTVCDRVCTGLEAGPALFEKNKQPKRAISGPMNMCDVQDHPILPRLFDLWFTREPTQTNSM